MTTSPFVYSTADRTDQPSLDTEKVLRIGRAFETGFRMLWPGFPYGCCVEASMILHAALDSTYVNAQVRTRSGKYDGRLHQWIEASDGTIIDPTLGQFVGGPALHIIAPDDVRYGKFEVM